MLMSTSDEDYELVLICPVFFFRKHINWRTCGIHQDSSPTQVKCQSRLPEENRGQDNETWYCGGLYKTVFLYINVLH